MRFQRIETSVRKHLRSVIHLEIEDESHKHVGHKGHESHFRIFLVSDDFAGKTRVQRQGAINKLLAVEFENGLHALSMRLLTPEEFEKQESAFLSPDCRSQSK